MSSSTQVNPTCNYAGLSDELNIGKINEMASSTSTRANKALDEYQKQLDAHNEIAKKKIADSTYTAAKNRNKEKHKIRDIDNNKNEQKVRKKTR
mgnify:CR=1 FL=1